MNIKYMSLLSFFCVVAAHGAKLPDKYEFSKNTCNRTWHRQSLSDEDKNHYECCFSRFEVYDHTVKSHIAHIAYSPSDCYIQYLRINDEYKGQGLGRELARKALLDLIEHGCKDVRLSSTREGVGFWEKLGAKPNGYQHVFSDLSSGQLILLNPPKKNLESFSVDKMIFFTDL